jgi:hypothetical protein
MKAQSLGRQLVNALLYLVALAIALILGGH